MRLNIGGRKLHAGGGQCAFARILLGNGVRKCGIYSVLCTTREAELRFIFSYLQLLGLYSKSPKLAFNQWVAGSSPARLIFKFSNLASRVVPAFCFSPTFSPTSISLFAFGPCRKSRLFSPARPSTSPPYCGQFRAFLYPAACASASLSNGTRFRSDPFQ